MPSLIPGYEYDIFISYRQKDNAYDGWVTAFVENLKRELAGTFKEEVSIYFDANPSDGLLDYQTVDKSLDDKLKSVILLPIISQTYCDPKSYAWANEFCAFNRIVKQEPLGRDIKLASGNFANRILPVRIHELEVGDRRMLESELGGPLRSIDFIYKSAGVNRPLNQKEEHPHDNFARTYYRDQINKVANAVKEIIQALRTGPSPEGQSVQANRATQPTTTRFSLKWKLALVALSAVLVAGYFVLRNQNDTDDKSIAVLAFVDMTPEKDMEYLSDGIADEIINMLSRIKGLKVIGQTSSFQFKGKGVDLRTIGESLGVGNILEGSIRRSGDRLKVSARLVRVETMESMWTGEFNKTLDDVLEIEADVARVVASRMKTELQLDKAIAHNEEVHLLVKQGDYLLNKRDRDSFVKSIDFYKRAIQVDSTDATAWAGIAAYYYSAAGRRPNRRELVDAGLTATRKAIELDPTLARAHLEQGKLLRAFKYDFSEAARAFSRSAELEPSNPNLYNARARLELGLRNFAIALQLARQAIAADPYSDAWLTLGFIYLATDKLDSATYAFRRMIELFPLEGRSLRAIGFIHVLKKEYGEAMSIAEMLGDHILKSEINYMQGNREVSEIYLDSILQKPDINSAFQIAEVCAFIGKADLAFKWLNISYESMDGGLSTLKWSRPLVSLLNDRRWAEMLRRMNLPVD